MRIVEDVKLDFKDVLILPKRSTLSSRKEVELTRTYQFKHSEYNWTGVPIMAANMDGVGTWSIANKLQEHKLFTCLVKSYDFTIWADNRHTIDFNHVAISTGTRSEDWDKTKLVLESMNIQFVCIDVANGYTESFVKFVEKVRQQYPKITIIAGNVVTPEMTEELILRGADIVKVGIGPGCFAPGQKVKTDKGLKNIEDIKQGEKVLTHTGSYKTVTNTFKFDDKKCA